MGFDPGDIVREPRKLFLSLLPWVVFSVMVQRRGSGAAGVAALVATASSLWFCLRAGRFGSVKAIDATGVLTFGALALASVAGGAGVTTWIAHYGRSCAAFVLALVMLGSVLVSPFTEQYARESVPAQYWSSPVFRAVNRRISLLWGVTVLVMSAGHLVAGRLAATASSQTAHLTGFLLNWALPVALITVAVRFTNHSRSARPTRLGQDSRGRVSQLCRELRPPCWLSNETLARHGHPTSGSEPERA